MGGGAGPCPPLTNQISIMQKEEVTLRQFLQACRILEEDVDIYVDGIDGIAYCGERLTNEGEKHFARALDLPMDGHAVISNDDADYDEDNENSALQLAWELLAGGAGYCSCEDYDKWFIID